MSVKNDRWIQHMNEKYGMISPYVTTQVGEGIISYGPSSFGYDMRAGCDWKIFTNIYSAVVDPKNMDPRAFHDIVVNPSEAVTIPPNSYALTHTIEYVTVPRNVTCVCLGKSTYARVGIHVNVTPLEAGWEGQVTVEISNSTGLPVKVYAGEGIMQVLFFEGEDPRTSYADRKGKYQNQRGVTLARVLDGDGEKKVLSPKAALEEQREAVKKAMRRTGHPTKRTERSRVS